MPRIACTFSLVIRGHSRPTAVLVTALSKRKWGCSLMHRQQHPHQLHRLMGVVHRQQLMGMVYCPEPQQK